MSSTPSQDPQYPEPTEGSDRVDPGTQEAPLERAEPEAPYELTDAGAPAAPVPTSEPVPAPASPAPGLDDTGTISSPYDEPGAASVAGSDPAPWVTTTSPAPSGTPDVPAPDTHSPVTPATALSADSATRPHRVERPVPRSGLTEHHSAGYLTGERIPPPEPAGDHPTWLGAAATPDAETTAAPATNPDAAAASPGAGEAPARRSWTSLPPSGPATGHSPDTAVILDGASVEPQLRSRAKAHWLAALVTILLVPIAWYLLADAGARLTLPAGSPWQTGNLNIAAVLELVGGLAVLTVVLLAARWSSVGSIVAGSLVIVLGAPFIAVPTWTQELLEPALQWLRDFNDLGGNVAHHLVASGSTGRLLIIGLGLVLLGVVSHGARRQGRREAIARARLGRD